MYTTVGERYGRLPTLGAKYVPQHHTASSLSMAQEWEPPAASAETDPIAAPSTAVGTSTFPLTVPVPSCPSSLAPQHWTAPSLVNAQVWLAPAAISVAPCAHSGSAQSISPSESSSTPSWQSVSVIAFGNPAAATAHSLDWSTMRSVWTTTVHGWPPWGTFPLTSIVARTGPTGNPWISNPFSSTDRVAGALTS